uniref:Uncharacterized protein n=1 Tax=Candidatus Kentrum sp. TC TaxID=2126339 RepID=A0A451A1G8_9GAMM|nr:MAG: hypothetical protein BECKTC1821F_GA0114240_103816 [Candidatus Kentron sp. TC]
MDEISQVTKEVVVYSSRLTTWALSVFAGTIAAIISTSYIRPSAIQLRISNLLFIPGWVCLSFSIHNGEQLVRKYLASIMVKSDAVINITSKINNVFSDQRLYFYVALMFFGAWLLVFLLQWVFVQKLTEDK